MSATTRCLRLLAILESGSVRSRKSVSQLAAALDERGYHVSHRTVLRDLDVLSIERPTLQRRMEGNTGYWFVQKE